MTHPTRRTLLKGLAAAFPAAFPAAWTPPVVQSVVLPAHAQTSAPTSQPTGSGSGCGADQGCYIFAGSSFFWPGGQGPFPVEFFEIGNMTCDETGSAGSQQGVVAASMDEAVELVDCEGVVLFATDPPLPDGCDFFFCD